jgi:uroporphyrinogen-III synthase
MLDGSRRTSGTFLSASRGLDRPPLIAGLQYYALSTRQTFALVPLIALQPRHHTSSLIALATMSESKGVAIVTGASAGECGVDLLPASLSRTLTDLNTTAGIGKASAIALGKEGWTVVITARDEAKLKETASEIEKSLVVPGDLVSG